MTTAARVSSEKGHTRGACPIVSPDNRQKIYPNPAALARDKSKVLEETVLPPLQACYPCAKQE
jgi:hypothetical protein